MRLTNRGGLVMDKSYNKLVATKLDQHTHDILKKLAKEDRRPLSSMCRIIIENFVDDGKNTEIKHEEKKYES